MSELRRDPILGRWVIISSERTHRPRDFRFRRDQRSSGGFCPFCPGNESTTPGEIAAYRPDGSPPNGPGWTLRVVPNKFPALQIEGDPAKSGDELFTSMSGLGAHEVIIESPDHDGELASLSVDEAADVLRTYRDRISDLARDSRLKYVMIFKNHGPGAGATLEHPHSQLIALPVVPQLIEDEIAGSLAFHRRTGRCIFCDILSRETGDGSRVVSENEHFVAFCPFASSYSFETWIVPKIHGSHFEPTESELSSLAILLRDILDRIRRLLGDPDYNFVLHPAPLGAGSLPHYHWHLEIVPHLTPIAGFEWGAGFTINPMPPEDAAAFLRKAQGK